VESDGPGTHFAILDHFASIPWTVFPAGVSFFLHAILKGLLPHQQMYGGTVEIEEGL
jgi:hypothetical protein